MKKEKAQMYRHAGYQLIKLGKEIETIGEQLVEEDKDENRARSLVIDVLDETSKVAKAASRTRADYHAASLVIAIILAIILAYCIMTATTATAAAACGACFSCVIVVGITNLSLLLGDI